MTRIVVLGGTGYTGANIVAEAASRGLEVTSWSRSLPEAPIDGVTYETGSLLDADTLARAVKGADVVVGALSPRGELDGKLRDLYLEVANLVAAEGARWVVVGGFGSLRPAEGAGRIARGDDFPAEYAEEARTGANTVDDLLEKAPANLDWLFVSPAANYGSHTPGEKRGSYRVSGDVALFTESGESAISGVDYATALVDEIETPKHNRAHIGFVH
jgi:hypothetical protein